MPKELEPTIRQEEPRDLSAIYRVNKAAFGGEHEPKLVDQLRTGTDLVISLVAEIDGKVVGHVAMSRIAVTSEDAEAGGLALAPVAVEPDRQRHGIGSALIRKAIEVAAQRGEAFILVLGHNKYYPRFGFSVGLPMNLRHPFPADSFMALELKPGAMNDLRGRVRYPSAFGLAPEWTR